MHFNFKFSILRPLLGLLLFYYCSLTAQSAFWNNFENIVNRRVDIRKDIKRYQDTLSYVSSKVDYSVRENLFMLPSDIELRIKTGTVGYDNKILVSDGNFSLGKNDEVNSLETPAIKSHKTNSLETPALESHSNTVQRLGTAVLKIPYDF